MALPPKVILAVAAADVPVLEAYNLDPAPGRTLRSLLALAPGRVETAYEALKPAHLDRSLDGMTLIICDRATLPDGTNLFPLPDGLGRTEAEPPRPPEGESSPVAPPAPPAKRPESLSDEAAVAIACQEEVEKLATFLRARLSLLVVCEKLIAGHLCKQILAEARIPHPDGRSGDIRLEPVYLDLQPRPGADDPLASGGNNSRLAELRKLISDIKPGQVLVIRHLDLMSGGDKTPGRDARELTELIYSALDRTVLAFADPTLTIPEVIAARFAVRAEVQGLRPEVPDPTQKRADGKSGRRLIGDALVTADEAAHFAGFAAGDLYKYIAGLNPVRLRQAVTYAVQMARDEGHDAGRPASAEFLYAQLRAFKAQTAEQFIVPQVKFEDIGGYDEVKKTLFQAIGIMAGAGKLPDEKLRTELVPRGFLFHGPPGTGKTLFAKAIANELKATVRIISGPEITDMYVGESERKLRAIFAEARRNAPSVLVFDEFDSIAASRSGRDDGGSRAGNALVAQILTEMDGFRPDVPMLVIGTTNRLGLIDKALLRPSRFQPVAIGLPNLPARRRIAEIHAGHFKIETPPALLDLIAEASDGLNGDEIRSVFRDAAVGFYCEGIPADALRLGYLLGRVRTRLDAETGAEPEPVRHNPADGRRRPGPGHASLTGTPLPSSPREETPPS